MKATIDVPDDLYRRVKAKSAMQGRPVREVVVTLFRGWIEESNEDTPAKPLLAVKESTPAWFGAARKYAQGVAQHDMAAIRRSVASGRAHDAAGKERGV